MPSFRTLDDFRLSGRRVLLRLDLNVPLADGRVTGLERIDRTLGTVRELSRGGARTVILSHLGRPKGRPAPGLSLAPVARALSSALGRPVPFARDTVGAGAREVVSALRPGDVAMVENLRFSPGEEGNDAGFAAQLACLGEIHVNDAFSVSHRAHASVSALAGLLPSCAGRLMEEEVRELGRALSRPERPVAAIVGGAKVSTKLAILENLSGWADLLVVGGAMANTFLAARGIGIGASLHEPDMVDVAKGIMKKAESRKRPIALPVDAVTGEDGARVVHESFDTIGRESRILDIGPATVATLSRRLATCRTVVWNGPMGAFERPGFDAGTTALARAIADLTARRSIHSVAGGGDTASALTHAGAADGFSYVSTAGGAFLAWLEGSPLPGLVALETSLCPERPLSSS